jgi:hypothetical protein
MPSQKLLPLIEELKELFQYDQETGWLIRKIGMGSRARAGERAGYSRCKGYRKIQIQGRQLFEHRVIWAIMHGSWPINQIDHVNGDKGDNRLENLREATQEQNLANRRVRKDSLTGMKGIRWNVKRQKWEAIIQSCGKQIYLGRFETPEEAHAAYCDAAEKHHGEFMRVA